jgi:hypothetical protein
MIAHITEVVALALTALLALLLIAITVSKSFRTDVLGSAGDATVFGIFTARGAVVVLLSVLLIGGIVITSLNTPEAKSACKPGTCTTSSGKCGVVELTVSSVLRDGRKAPDSRSISAATKENSTLTGNVVAHERAPSAVWQCN